ncbi:MAG TPA: ABC transporter permease [Candidatus Sulfotelmatobacter sp.]|nr:ABC transporter permease [Candidatus Sulfotelmatobacter sp.]
MRTYLTDLRHALRSLRRNPAFAIGAILVLALGIGANTAIFSLVNAAMLRPLPFNQPDQLVQVWHVPPAKSFPGMDKFSVSPANYLDWKAQSTSFDSMSIYNFRSLSFGGADHPEVVEASAVGPDFFTVLRAKPLLGRTFTPDDDKPSARVILLSYNLWRDRFASDPGIVGRDITVNSERYTVIGVMPDKFRMPDFAWAWVPIGWTDADRAIRGNHNYLVIARLKPQITIDQAKSELSAISTRLEQQYPEDDKGWGAMLVPLREQFIGDVRTALLVLLGAVAFVLLIACANVANLVLAKTLARGKEMAIRSALGAGRAVLLRHILVETLLLSLLGGTLGFLLARVVIALSTNLLADRLPAFMNATLDAQVLIYTLLLSVAAGVLAGLFPSLRFSRVDLNEILKQGSRGSSDTGGKTRNLLVVCEVALSLVLLIGAGLMIRTLWQLRNVQPGFDSGNVLTMTVAVPRNHFPTPSMEANFFQEVLQRVKALPGVQEAGLIDSLPLDGSGSHQPFSIEGRPLLPMADQPEVDVRVISTGYLRTMRTPVIRGRDFAESDAAGRPGVVMISESLAQRFWPNEDPLGKHLTLTFFSGVREIVGIVQDVKLDRLDDKHPVDAIYMAVNQLAANVKGPWNSYDLSLAVRTKSDPRNATTAVTDAIHQVGPDIPVTNVLRMDDILAQSISPQRFNMMLLAVFAGLALLLAAVGIYGVLSYSVRRRVREIGIRMALGASQSDILRLVVSDGMKPIFIGVTVGLVAAFALSRLVASLLFGVPPTDPLTFTAVALLLVIVGIAANTLPAYRATRVEPTQTLREE